MKKLAYPVLFTKIKEGYYVTVPDFDAHTQGKALADAISMARDLICLASIDLEDDGKTVPQPGQKNLQLARRIFYLM
jgi:predicted RNase H-like HicB family nuclease